MHLPTPQFSRIVTLLAFDVADPSLDSMILAWDHIAARYLKRSGVRSAEAARIESVRLLAIHDAVISIFGRGEGFVFRELSDGTSLGAALAATAQASHDILASAFVDGESQTELRYSLEESLSFVSDPIESSVGQATGAASAGALLQVFGARTKLHRISTERNLIGSRLLTENQQEAAFAGAAWKRSA